MNTDLLRNLPENTNNPEDQDEPLELLSESNEVDLSIKESRDIYSSDSTLAIQPEIKDSLEKSLVENAEVWEALSKL